MKRPAVHHQPHKRLARAVPRAGFGLALLILLWPIGAIGGCKITIGGGGSYGNLNLTVPFYSQGSFLLCGPTSVLMWRRFDNLSYIEPSSLGTMMGCPWQTSGCSLNQLTSGTNFYTASGSNAYLDDYGGVGDPDVLLANYAARQITSLVNGVPVIGLINGALHAVVVRAGNYTTASDGLKRWDYVYVHDPFSGANQYYTGGNWLNTNIFQVISSSASFGWQSNLETYGEIHVLGWGEWPPHGGNWPPEV